MNRIYHLITCLEIGGAEVFLYRLVKGLLERGHACRVGSLVRSAPVDAWLRELGVEVDFLDMKPGRPNPLVLRKFLKIQRRWKPDVLQTWMYHADLLGLSARLMGQRNIIWNVRCTDMDLAKYSRVTALTVRACARLSGLPRCVLTNAHAARDFHLKLGYHPRAFQVIPNGYDTQTLRPAPEIRAAMRKELGLAEQDIAVGLAARFDPMKGHAVFAQAAGLILERQPHARFVLYGENVNHDNEPLVQALRTAKALHRCLLLGRRDDAPNVHQALDIAVSSSLFGEGFSNTIAEAMACGVPCVGTDVGDTARIIADTGHVAPPNDPEALAEGVAALAGLDSDARRAMGRAAHTRIVEHYSLDRVVDAYAALYAETVQG